jgi:hypothetical protein
MHQGGTENRRLEGSMLRSRWWKAVLNQWMRQSCPTRWEMFQAWRQQSSTQKRADKHQIEAHSTKEGIWDKTYWQGIKIRRRNGQPNEKII